MFKNFVKNQVNSYLEKKAPLQLICNQLHLIASKRKSINEQQYCYDIQNKLSDKMVDRNLDGIILEKSNKIDKAIKLYELNVYDQFDGSHPYERLRIIYTKRKDYDNAIRICQIYLKLSIQAEKKKAKFQHHLDRLMKKKESK